MDLLYGEVPADERAALEAHVAGCAACRAELAGFQATRAAARGVLAADSPPARAHQAILRAAAAAVAAQQAQPIAARPALARPSFWERLRLRWTLPTFATVGAVAVVVLASKVFLEPEKTVALGRQTVHPTAAEAPPVPAVTPQPAPREALKAEQPPKREASSDHVESEKQPAMDKPLTRPTAAHHHAASRVVSDNVIDGLGSAKGASAPERQKARDYLDDVADGREGASPAPRPSERVFAPPPPAEAPRPPAASAVGAKHEVAEKLTANVRPASGQAGGGRPQGSAAAAAPPIHVAKAKKTSASDDDEFASAPPAAATEPAPPPPAPAAPSAARGEAEESRRADTKTASKPGGESPVAHADRLYAEGRWAEAARAYRELLRRDPRNADAPRWRQRLTAAEAAIAPEAKAAAAPAE